MNAQQTELIHQGKLIFDETPKYAGSYVGSKLACSDCRTQSGTAAYAAPMIELLRALPHVQQARRTRDLTAEPDSGVLLPQRSRASRCPKTARR